MYNIIYIIKTYYVLFYNFVNVLTLILKVKTFKTYNYYNEVEFWRMNLKQIKQLILKVIKYKFFFFLKIDHCLAIRFNLISSTMSFSVESNSKLLKRESLWVVLK